MIIPGDSPLLLSATELFTLAREQHTSVSGIIKNAVSAIPELQQKYAALENRLLAYGGSRMVYLPEPHLVGLLSHGQVFDGRVVLKRGLPNRCHENVAALWNKNRSTSAIVTGYALSDDGLWRQHSWLLRKQHVIETTMRRERYFGVVLDLGESLRFADFVLP